MIPLLIALHLPPSLQACVERKRAHFTKQRLKDARVNCQGIHQTDCGAFWPAYKENFMRAYGPRKSFGVRECRKELGVTNAKNHD